MLAHGSTTQFSIWFLSSVTEFLDRHEWTGWVIGAILLGLAIAGPEMKDWTAKQPWTVNLKLPKTTGERLRSIESQYIPNLDHDLGVMEKRLNDIQSGLIKTWGEHGIELNNTKHELGVLQQSASTLTLRISELDARFIKVLPAIACLCEMISFIRESDYCLEKFRFIYDTYQDSDVVARPLDRSWRIQMEPDADKCGESRRLGIEWAEFLDRHIIRVSEFFANRAILFDGETEALLRYAQNLTSYKDKNGTACIGLLETHRKHLRDIRDSYAAFVTGSKVSVAIS
jgi:hypothetical protein